MSELDKLIKKYCPNGVEYKELNDVVISLNTGLNPRNFFKLNTEDAENYYVTIREMCNGKIRFTDKTDRINEEAINLCNNRSNLEEGDVLFSGTGTIGETVVICETPYNWNIKEGIYSIKPNQSYIISSFLSYLLVSSEIKKSYLKKVAGGTVKSIPMVELKKIKIPVPPLEVQREIVRILDSFTLLTAELTAELTARKKQYEYYRDELLKPKKTIPLVTLKEIATSIYRGSGIKREQITESGIPCVRYGEIYTTYNTWFDKCVSHTQEECVSNPKYFEHGDILFAITGESVEDIAKSIAYVGNEKCMAGGDIVVMKHQQNPRYLSHVLNTSFAREQKSKGKVKSKVVHSNVPSIEQIKIPLPSLEVQKRYADVLDNFEQICNDLNIGLPAEIEARKKQYEYYRDLLLTFAETGNIIATDSGQRTADSGQRTADSGQRTADSGQRTADSGQRTAVIKLVQYVFGYVPVKLKHVASYSKAKIDAADIDKDTYVGVDNLLQDKKGKTSSNYVPSSGKLTCYQLGDVLIGNIRPYLRKIWLATNSGGTNGDVLVVRGQDSIINSRFLYYCLSSEDFFEYDNKYSKGAKMPRGDKEAIMDYQFEVPTLEEQERIVSILDRFDSLCNDISTGLPAEIEARKKQYEYYRDKLLSFE